MSQYLTVKDATKFVGKSESTIKRLLREITATADHPDRKFVQPSYEEVEARKAAGEPYAWKIAQELLLQRYPQDTATKQGSDVNAADPAAAQATHDVIIGVLREQLQSKDRQIETLEQQLDRKDEQIGHQNERMREQNILMKDLQQRLAITAPNKPADIMMGSEPKEGSQAPNKFDTPIKEKTSIWRREFRLFGKK